MRPNWATPANENPSLDRESSRENQMRLNTLLSLVVLLAAATAVSADESVEIRINGVRQGFQALVRNGFAYVPLRQAAEARLWPWGVTVDWQDGESEVIVRFAQRTDRRVSLEEKIVVDGRLFVPLQKLGNVLEAQVTWKGGRSPVAITTRGAAYELETEHSLSTEFRTPHTDWAQPYAKGKVRVLWFGRCMGTKGREPVELLQRFDLVMDAVYHDRVAADSPESTVEWVGKDLGIQRMMGLLERPYEVYVFFELPLSLLSAKQRQKVLDRVAKGAGIVFIERLRSDKALDDGLFQTKTRLAKLPALLAPGGAVCEAFSVGDGRGVRVLGHPDIPYRVGWEVEYDYWQERLGRAVLWAAGREPEMELSLDAGSVTYRSARAGKTRLELTLRREDGWTKRLPDIRCSTTNGHANLSPFSNLRAGDYHIEARALSDRGVETWTTAAFTIACPRKLEFLNASVWGEIGERISGQVRLSGAPAPNETLEVRLIDRRGRILAHKPVTMQDEEGKFEFTTEPWMPMLLRVEALLRSGPDEVASAYRFFNVTRRNRGQFNFLVWDTPHGTLAPFGLDSLAQQGVTLILGNELPAPVHAAYEMAWVPYTTHLRPDKPAFWNDEPAIQNHINYVVQVFEPARRHGTFAFSLGDEIRPEGSSTDPKCLEVYRRYLSQEYGTIAALNNSWGTQFASFSEVGLSKADDNDEKTALAAGDYARWYDRQAYQCWNFVQHFKRFDEAFKVVNNDPQARTGFEGAASMYHGDDLDLMSRAMGFWVPYGGAHDEVIRSVAGRDLLRSNWIGYTKDADSLLARYWRTINLGCDSVWWWMWEGRGTYEGLLGPTLAPYPHIREMLEDTRVVRDGLGTLLVQSKMLDDRIAILYSLPSMYSCRVEQGPTYGNYQSACEEANTVWPLLIRDLGLQFKYVTDRMLRLGEFRPEDFRVLILPQVEAIGPQEAKVIRDFVEQGGTVIADVRPGSYDGHCKPMKKGYLDDLFGIARGAQAKAAASAVKVSSGVDGTPLAIGWQNARVDPSVHSTDGKALGTAGETPVCIVKQTGKGRAILLNFAMTSFPDLAADWPHRSSANPVEARGAWRLLGSVFANAGVSPAISVVDAKGDRPRNAEVTRWQNERIELVSLFNVGMGLSWMDVPHDLTPQPVRVTLPEARYVYDMRNRKALGLVKTFKTNIIPCRASFFALLPAKSPKIELILDKTSVAQGELVTASLSLPGSAGLHAVRVRVSTPDGRPADWLDKVLTVGRKPVELALPIAFNDPPGRWTIRATELFSGRSTEARLLVRKR